MATQLSDDNKTDSPLSDSQAKRVSHRKPKRKPTSDDEEAEEKMHILKRSSKGCHKASCSNRTPICCISATEKCTGSGYTSRWNHLSPGEHFCNECFEYFYRSHKDGYAAFDKWRKLWSTHGRTDPTMSAFLSDQYLPNWVQCVIPSCGKWRQLSVDADLSMEFIQKFTCGMSISGVKKERQYEACCVPEDFRVKLPKAEDWFGNCNSICLMRNSPITPYVTEYFPDGVGLSPSDPYLQKFPKGKSSRQAADDVLQLLYQPDEAERALSFRPDMMEDDELREFSYMICHHTGYVGLRNLVLVLWQENFKSWLTPAQCIPHINCRGLSRIACITLIEKIIRYLTRKAVINIGLIGVPPGEGFLPANYNQHSVIVVGAGAAGIAAARQLKNYGTKVTIVEAQHRIGGRVWDDHSMGRCVGRGAQIVVGCINNPISVMCKQLGTVTCAMSEKCDLITEAGVAVNPAIDRRIDFHFNAILDIIADWRKNKDIEQDISLLDKFFEMHHQFSEEAQILFTEEEEKLLHFHISNVEYACGCRLDKVSALNWDQNEAFPQFAGNHVLLPNGHSDILSRLAHGIDISYNAEITAIDYSGDNVIVKTKTGRNWTAKKAIITVPLTALQSCSIQFTPCLPEEKSRAIQGIGAGIIEKVVMQFEHQFWTEKMNGADYIGHVPNNPSERGMFGVFYDLSTSKNSKCQCPILMTHVSGEALSWLDGKTDQQVIDACLAKLRLLFPEQKISNPIKFFVTNWRKDPYAKMAYSYLPIGSDGSLYDIMAQDVNNKIFFAGEATHRQFPQTVTGAFLSGIREAEKIVLLSANEPENAPSPNKERTL